jgi:hypothetical protein
VARLSAWVRWQDAAGPWRGWAVCPALTMPAEVPDSIVSRMERTDLAAGLADVLSAAGTAVVLDLEPSEGVRLAADANRLGLAHVVVVLPRWPHAEALLPTDELIATLVGTAQKVQPISSTNVIFVLDAERERSLRRPASDQRVDNRYALPVGDLPGLAALRSAGIQRVVRVVRSR